MTEAELTLSRSLESRQSVTEGDVKTLTSNVLALSAVVGKLSDALVEQNKTIAFGFEQNRKDSSLLIADLAKQISEINKKDPDKVYRAGALIVAIVSVLAAFGFFFVGRESSRSDARMQRIETLFVEHVPGNAFEAGKYVGIIERLRIEVDELQDKKP